MLCATLGSAPHRAPGRLAQNDAGPSDAADGFHLVLNHCVPCHGDYRAAPRPGCEHVDRPFFRDMHVTEARVRLVVRRGIRSHAAPRCLQRMPASTTSQISDAALDLMIGQLRVERIIR